MAISKKKKRKIVVNNREFYWYMKLTEDWMYAYNTPQLYVISEDKNFLISYQPGQQNENPFLIIKGKEFRGIKEANSSWIRVKTPAWNETQITPGFVARIINWCLYEDHDIVFVDYLGKILT